jgi:hypothetical protein
MFTRLDFSISESQLSKALLEIPNIDFKHTINKPTGRFFYDPWVINDDLKGSIWEEVLATLPFGIGEARLIKLDPGICYRSHADIDDRYHISLIAEKSYLIDLDNDLLYPLTVDKQWYKINTGLRHSAANFGNKERIQLVVRELLSKESKIKDPLDISITPKTDNPSIRFIFDDIISPALNLYSKNGLIENFKHQDNKVSMTIDKSLLSFFKELDQFNIHYVN